MRLSTAFEVMAKTSVLAWLQPLIVHSTEGFSSVDDLVANIGGCGTRHPPGTRTAIEKAGSALGPVACQPLGHRSAR